MPMIECPECGAKVSSKAAKCPSCGVQIHKPRRGFFGVLFKWTFILFNIAMVVWLVSYFGLVGEGASAPMSEAEQAGTAIGATIGTGLILGFWAAGDVVLGLLVLLTRPKA